LADEPTTTRDAFATVLSLKSLPDLAQAHPDDLIGLASRAVERRHRAGDRIAESDSLLLLLEGSLRDAERRQVDAAPAVLRMLPVLAGEPGPALLATTDAVTLEIARPELLELLETEFELWVAALRVACRGASSLDAPREPERGPRLDATRLAERIVLLRSTSPFAALPVCLIGELASEAERVVVEPGTQLWDAGDPASHALLIVAGRAEAEAGPRSRDFAEGALVGLPETLAADGHAFRLRARTPLTALRFEGEALVDALEDDPASAVEFLCALARRLRAVAGDVPVRGGPE
jgi:hypothetical protein